MRAYQHLRVRLKKADPDKLDDVLGGGVQPVRTVFRALALGHLHEGKSASEIAAMVPLTSKAVREIGRRYVTAGLESALLRQAAARRGTPLTGRSAAAHHRHGL